MKRPVIAIIAIAFLLRLGAVMYGLPQSFGADELVSVLGAFTILERGHLFGTDLVYLPPLFSYILTPFFGAFGVFGMIFGMFSGIAGFREYVIFHYENFLWVVRVISALFGAGTVAFVYLIGQRVISERVGFFAELFLAFSFMHVHESQIGRFWVPATFFIVAGAYALIRMREERSFKWYILSALAIGLGFGIGYVPLILLPWFFLSHAGVCGGVPRDAKSMVRFFGDRKFLYGAGIIVFLVAVFSFANPYAFARQFGWLTAGAASVFGIELSRLTQKAVGTDVLQNAGLFIYNLWSESPLLLIAGIAGLIGYARVYRRKRLISSLFLALPALYGLGIVFGFHRIDWRFVLPVVPFLALGAAHAFFIVRDRWSGTISRMALYACYATGLLVYAVWPTLSYTALLQRSDTRTLAVLWIEEHAAPGSTIVLDDYSVYVSMSAESVRDLARYNAGGIDTRRKEILAHPERGVSGSGWRVYEMNRLLGTDFDVAQIHEGFIVYSYWHSAQRMEKEERFARVPKTLVVSFWPASDVRDIRDLVNNPTDPEEMLRVVRRPGPYVEIYQITSE